MTTRIGHPARIAFAIERPMLAISARTPALALECRASGLGASTAHMMRPGWSERKIAVRFITHTEAAANDHLRFGQDVTARRFGGVRSVREVIRARVTTALDFVIRSLTVVAPTSSPSRVLRVSGGSAAERETARAARGRGR